MLHVESVESRQLFAALTPDAAFAGGSVPLPREFGNSVLATHGGVYVGGYHVRRGAFFVYKYTEEGQLDTTWGQGGYVRPRTTHNVRDGSVVPKMTFDARTGGLLLTIDGGRTISVERLTATGLTDSSWGGGDGVFEYTVRNRRVNVGEVLPLAKKSLAIAFTSTEQSGLTYDGRKTDGGAADLMVARLDRRGRFDSAFNNGSPFTAVGGHIKTQEYGDGDSGSKVVNINAPIFGDLEETTTGVRLASLREKTSGTYQLFDGRQGSYKYGRTDWIVDTIDVYANGLDFESSAARINRDDNEPDFFPNPPVIAGDDVAVLSTVPRTNGLSETVKVTRLRDGGIFSSGTIGGGTESLISFTPYRNAYGLTLGLVFKSDSRYFVRLNKDLSLRKRYDPQGERFPIGGYSTSTIDDSGRLVWIETSASGVKTLHRLTVI